MKLDANGVLLGLALIALGAALPVPATAEGVDAVTGLWDGPWYRGMTSGKVKVKIEGAGGTIQFTNLDNYGDAPHALTNVTFDGKQGAAVSYGRGEGRSLDGRAEDQRGRKRA
jgi:hypothetical protein